MFSWSFRVDDLKCFNVSCPAKVCIASFSSVGSLKFCPLLYVEDK